MSCDDLITKEDLTNAKLDAETMAEVANSREGGSSTGEIIESTTTRLGDTVSTVLGQLSKMGYEVPIDYAGSIAFTVDDSTKTIDRDGVIYAPFPSALPFTTTGTWVGDDEDNFYVVQVTEQSLTESVINQLTVEDYIELRAKNITTLIDGQAITVTNTGIAGDFVIRNSVAHGITDNGGTLIVIDADWYAERIYFGPINVIWFGAVGDGIADDTAPIQSAFDCAISLAARAEVRFAPGFTYKVDQVQVRSLFIITVEARGSAFKLNFSGGAAFEFQGAEHRWYGGRVSPQTTSASHMPRMFDFTQSASFPQCNGVKVYDVTCRDLYQFALCYMDDVAFPSNSNFRHTFTGCVNNNTVNGQSSWAGSYGIRFDGTTALNSAGNDSRCIDCDMLNVETCFYTNGVKTQLTNCARDGQAVGVELDGATQFTSIGGYSEFHANHYKYTNSPTDPISIGTLYGGLGSFSSGTLGSGSTNGRHLRLFDIGLELAEELKNCNVVTTGADCYRGKTTTGASFAANILGSGDALTVEDNGSEVGSITLDGGIMTIQSSTSLQMDSPVLQAKTDGLGNIGGASKKFGKMRSNQYDLGSISTPGASTLNQLYIDSADGDFKIKFANGVVKTIATN